MSGTGSGDDRGDPRPRRLRGRFGSGRSRRDPRGGDPSEPDDASASPLGRAGRAGVQRLSGSVRSLFERGGVGFRDLAITQVFSTSADTLVAIGLAGTLFFAVPTAEARGNVALYLLLTVAPFAVLGPTLGRVLDRTPIATRTLLVAAALGRAGVAVLLIGRLESLWLFPGAFALLVLSRVHGITRNSLLPLALDEPRQLVAANGRLAWIGVLAGGLAAAIGGVGVWLGDSNVALALAAVSALGAATVGLRLPEPDSEHARLQRESAPPGRRGLAGFFLHLPRSVRLAQLATAGVRVLNGFLLLLLAFELREDDASLLDFGALLAAAGAGFALASRVVPLLERRVQEEPMVVGALALMAGAAFTAGQWFGLVAAAALAGTTGVAWGVAKLAFDGLLQATVPAGRRGTAFTRSETTFSVAWVVGAIIPTAMPLPVGFGLVAAGFAALAAQIVYVGALLIPQDPRLGTAGPPPRDGPRARDASRDDPESDDPPEAGHAG